MQSMSEAELRDVFTNPYYATVLSGAFFTDHKIDIAAEDWVSENSRLFDELGANKWFSDLLEGLSSGTFTYVPSPTAALKMSDRLKGDHEPLITRKVWIEANEKLIKELGKEEWLWRFMKVLETGGPSV
jgi:hypothetical protein